MSKKKLQKEIAALERHQLEQMVIDAYEARKEIKEYFDFFLNPDTAKLTEKYKAAVTKELLRSKRGYSKARISVIRNMIRHFSGFHPGFDRELELLWHAFTAALAAESHLNFGEPLLNGTAAMMESMVEIADRNLVADRVLGAIIEKLDSPDAGTRYFRRFLRGRLEEIRPE